MGGSGSDNKAKINLTSQLELSFAIHIILFFLFQLNSMRRVWEVDEFNQIEATVLAELIETITDMDGDLSGFEVIGRFPTVEESLTLGISLPTPVWLKSGPPTAENSDCLDDKELESKLVRLRNELSFLIIAANYFSLNLLFHLRVKNPENNLREGGGGVGLQT